MAVRGYSVDHQTAAGSNLTILCVVSAGVREFINYICLGSDATPADVAAEFNAIRGTVSGTGTAVTARALDPGSPAANGAGEGGTFTGQTKTSNSSLLNIGMNQRTTYQWYAAPEREMVVPGTSDNWIGIESIGMSSGTPNINCTIHFTE